MWGGDTTVTEKNLKQVLDNPNRRGSISPVVSRKDAIGRDGRKPSETVEQGNASFRPTVAAVDAPRVARCDVVAVWLGISYDALPVQRADR